MKKKLIIIERDKDLGNSYRIIVDGTNDFRVVGLYEYGEDAIRDLPKTFPDIVLLNIDLNGKNGIEITEVIKRRYPTIEVLMISPYPDSGILFAALKAGVSGI